MKREGNEKEGEIVSSIGIDLHDVGSLLKSNYFSKQEGNEKEGEIALLITTILKIYDTNNIQ